MPTPTHYAPDMARHTFHIRRNTPRRLTSYELRGLRSSFVPTI